MPSRSGQRIESEMRKKDRRLEEVGTGKTVVQ